MSLFSFTYKHPNTGQLCTVDSGKPTQMAAFIDIVRYMRRTGLRKAAPKSAIQIKDETLRTIGSSHGQLTMDAAGNVVNRDLDNADSDGGGHLATITRFDLGEWRRHSGSPLPESLDILDLGYWYAHPETGMPAYEPPDAKWRADIAEILLERRVGAGRGARHRPSTHAHSLRAVPPEPGTLQRTRIYGPRHRDGGEYAALCELHDDKIARQMAAAYNAFDSAAKKLGLNAVEFAERMQAGGIAEVLEALAGLSGDLRHLIKQMDDRGYYESRLQNALALLKGVLGGAT